jgi:hypothetical protein
MWVVLAALVALFLLYFVYPLARGRPTVGAYLLGLSSTRDGNSVSLGFWCALRRVGWAFLGLCVFPFTLKTGLDAEGRTWYDRRSGLQVGQLGKAETPEAAGPPPTQGIAGVWYFMFAFVICGAAYWYNLAYPSGSSSFAQNETMQWRLYRYPKFNFSLESPFPLREKVFKPDPGVKRRILLTADLPEMGILIEVRGLEYFQALPPDALKQFSQYIPALFQTNPMVKDFKCSERTGTCSGLPAVFLEGTYASGETLSRFEAAGVVLGNQAWMVEIAVMDGPDMKYMADRIIKSLSLEGLGLSGAAR